MASANVDHIRRVAESSNNPGMFMSVLVRVCVYVYMCVCAVLCMCRCACMHVCVSLCVHVCAPTYIYILYHNMS